MAAFLRRGSPPIAELTWSTPRWGHVRMWLRVGRQVLGLRFWLRVTAASMLIFAVLIVAAKLAFPLLQVGFLWKATAVVPAMFGYMAFMIGIHVALPKSVRVRKDRISINHGQTTTIIPAKEIQATRLVFFSDDRALLRITYRQRGRRRSRTVGIKPGVDLKQLAELLPVQPRVSDLRR